MESFILTGIGIAAFGYIAYKVWQNVKGGSGCGCGSASSNCGKAKGCGCDCSK